MATSPHLRRVTCPYLWCHLATNTRPACVLRQATTSAPCQTKCPAFATAHSPTPGPALRPCRQLRSPVKVQAPHSPTRSLPTARSRLLSRRREEATTRWGTSSASLQAPRMVHRSSSSVWSMVPTQLAWALPSPTTATRPSLTRCTVHASTAVRASPSTSTTTGARRCSHAHRTSSSTSTPTRRRPTACASCVRPTSGLPSGSLGLRTVPRRTFILTLKATSTRRH